MTPTRLITTGVVLSGFALLFALLSLFQYRDPIVFVMGVQLIVPIWTVVAIIYVLRHGIPVRLVHAPLHEQTDESDVPR